jgi:hypothetical protein
MLTTSMRIPLAGVLVASSLVLVADLAGGQVKLSPREEDPVAVALGTNIPEVKRRILEAQVVRQRRYAEHVATCRRMAGLPADTVVPASSPSPLPVLSSDEKEMRRYGYGVTTQPPVPRLQETPRDGTTDAASLSGAGAGGDPAAVAAACASEAWQAVYGKLSALSDQYDEAESAMYEELANDPDVRAARERWRRCMGGKFSSPPEVAAYLRSRADVLSQRDSAEWARLQQEEMALAARDLACRAAVVDPVFIPKLTAAKDHFVREHRQLLADLRAALMDAG